MVIFLLSGMSMNTAVLLQAVALLPLHALVQLICFGITPAIGYCVARALRTAHWLNQDLVTGLIVSVLCQSECFQFQSCLEVPYM